MAAWYKQKSPVTRTGHLFEGSSKLLTFGIPTVLTN